MPFFSNSVSTQKQVRCCHYSRFANVETEAEEGQVTFLWLEGGGVRVKPGLSVSRALDLNHHCTHPAFTQKLSSQACATGKQERREGTAR